MASWNLPLLQTAGATTGSLLTTIIPFGAVILIFYFLIIRPQNKKQKETDKMLATLKKGDKVVTIGGLHGIIHAVKETTVVVKADDNCRLEFSRSAIASVQPEAKEGGKESAKGGKKAAAEAAVAAPTETAATTEAAAPADDKK
jgi:preprotein translocase subunit YajC